MNFSRAICLVSFILFSTVDNNCFSQTISIDFSSATNAKYDIIGFNTAGTFVALECTEAGIDITDVLENANFINLLGDGVADRGITLRYPGGNLSDFSRPVVSNPTTLYPPFGLSTVYDFRGYGYQSSDIEAIYPTSLDPVCKRIRDTWISKLDQQNELDGGCSYLEEFVEFVKQLNIASGGRTKVVYVANILSGNIAEEIAAINYIESGGDSFTDSHTKVIDVIGVELGNESISMKNCTTSMSLNKFNSVFEYMNFIGLNYDSLTEEVTLIPGTWVEKLESLNDFRYINSLPRLKVGVTMADGRPRNKAGIWNEDLAKFKGSDYFDAFIHHPYYVGWIMLEGDYDFKDEVCSLNHLLTIEAWTAALTKYIDLNYKLLSWINLYFDLSSPSSLYSYFPMEPCPSIGVDPSCFHNQSFIQDMVKIDKKMARNDLGEVEKEIWFTEWNMSEFKEPYEESICEDETFTSPVEAPWTNTYVDAYFTFRWIQELIKIYKNVGSNGPKVATRQELISVRGGFNGVIYNPRVTSEPRVKQMSYLALHLLQDLFGIGFKTMVFSTTSSDLDLYLYRANSPLALVCPGGGVAYNYRLYYANPTNLSKSFDVAAINASCVGPTYKHSYFSVASPEKSNLENVLFRTFDEPALKNGDVNVPIIVDSAESISTPVTLSPFSMGFIEFYATNSGITSPLRLSQIGDSGVIDESLENISVLFYPNPSDEEVSILLSNSEEFSKVVVYSTLGEIMYSESGLWSKFSLSVDEFSDGVYIVQLKLANGEFVYSEFFKNK